MPAVNYLSGRVAVLMGGTASEREISLQSGMAVLNSLQASGIDAVGIDTAGDLLADLEKTHPVFAFIAVHGAGGEDGKLQAVLELLGIPYSGSGVMADVASDFSDDSGETLDMMPDDRVSGNREGSAS